MGRRGYPPEFRRRVLDLVEAGRKVADVARDLGISEQTIYLWRRQDRVDRGKRDDGSRGAKRAVELDASPAAAAPRWAACRTAHAPRRSRVCGTPRWG